MAMIPKSAKLIHNPVSSAPGIHIGNVFILAGVPKIAQAMIDGILPTLVGGAPILTRTVNCFIAESLIAKDLTLLAEKHTELDIGSYPYFRPGGFGLSLVIRGCDLVQIDQAVHELCDIIRSLGGDPVLQELAHP
jgi:molybdopterin-biosynthesis enzyme MoeA-like protein